MGIENFYRRNVPGPDFKGYINIKREEERKRGQEKSLLRVFVERVIEEGRYGLDEAKKREYGKTGKRRRFTKEQLEIQDAEIRDNFAAIVLGNAVISLEETLVDGYFNYLNFVQRVNDSLVDIPLEVMLPQPAEAADFISIKQLNEMQVAAREDKTFTKFFEEEDCDRLLPIKLLKFFDNQYVVGTKIGACVQGILPEYKQLAESVVG